jgi:hypothetical protein
MKTKPNNCAPALRLLGFSSASLLVASLTGCVATKDHVIASTATVIGVELGQAPANTSPQAKLGYNRAEFAYVPTNRHELKSKDGPTTVKGADESADVLMELRYGDIFSGKGGIYQRLAVGKNAVSQGGAAVMFAKDAEGKMDANSASAVSSAVAAIKTTPTDILLAARPINLSYVEFSTLRQKLDVFDAAAKAAKFPNYAAFSAGVSTLDQVTAVRAELEKDADIKTALIKHDTK